MVISELSFLEGAYSSKELVVGGGFDFEASDFNSSIGYIKKVNSEDILIDLAWLPPGVPPGSSYEDGYCTAAEPPSCAHIYRTPSGELIRVRWPRW